MRVRIADSRAATFGAGTARELGLERAEPLDLGHHLRVGFGDPSFVVGEFTVEVRVREEVLVVVHGLLGGSWVGRSDGGSWFPSFSTSSRRPRAIRDFTVPTGMSSAAAISA